MVAFSVAFCGRGSQPERDTIAAQSLGSEDHPPTPVRLKYPFGGGGLIVGLTVGETVALGLGLVVGSVDGLGVPVGLGLAVGLGLVDASATRATRQCGRFRRHTCGRATLCTSAPPTMSGSDIASVIPSIRALPRRALRSIMTPSPALLLGDVSECQHAGRLSFPVPTSARPPAIFTHSFLIIWDRAYLAGHSGAGDGSPGLGRGVCPPGATW